MGKEKILNPGSSTFTNAMCKVLYSTIGYKQAMVFKKQITSRIRCRGIEETVNFLKIAYNAVLLRLDSRPDSSDDILISHGYSWSSKTMGTHRLVYKQLTECKSSIKASRYFTVLKLYSGFQIPLYESDLPELTKTIWSEYSPTGKYRKSDLDLTDQISNTLHLAFYNNPYGQYFVHKIIKFLYNTKTEDIYKLCGINRRNTKSKRFRPLELYKSDSLGRRSRVDIKKVDGPQHKELMDDMLLSP